MLVTPPRSGGECGGDYFVGWGGVGGTISKVKIFRTPPRSGVVVDLIPNYVDPFNNYVDP